MLAPPILGEDLIMDPMWSALLICLGAEALGVLAALIIWMVWFAPLYRKDGE